MSKTRIGAIDSELIKKTKQYKELTGIDTVKQVENLLSDFFKNALLTNDFLEIEKPFHFVHWGFNDYFYNPLIATLEVPSGMIDDYTPVEAKDIYMVKKIPNNLDTFDVKYNKFCYGGNPNRHKGAYMYPQIYKIGIDNLGHNTVRVDKTFLIFDYNENEQTLNIEVVPDIEELEFKIDLATHKEIYDNLVYDYNTFEDIIFLEDGSISIGEVGNSFEVIESLNLHLAIKNYLIKQNLYDECYEKSFIWDKKDEKLLFDPIDFFELISTY